MLMTHQQQHPVLSRRATALAALPGTPATCRAIIRTDLALADLDPQVISDAENVVTELASNAVKAVHKHADDQELQDIPVIGVAAAWWPGGVRIEVWDSAPGKPCLLPPDCERESGRGLFIVDQLTSHNWGWRRVGRDKYVWATLKQPELGQQSQLLINDISVIALSNFPETSLFACYDKMGCHCKSTKVYDIFPFVRNTPILMDDQHVDTLRCCLRESGEASDERWRLWAHRIIGAHELTPKLAVRLWKEALDFDLTLAAYAVEPLPLNFPAIIVAGSGKETFKTFNVSTAACILASAAGAYVVKGVSSSVSAVSGSADVLDTLGLPLSGAPETVPKILERDRIAFISYSAFCPAYADRYDGVFSFLNPFSLFMPVSVLAVQAAGFVYGIAHADVSLAGAIIRSTRPDLRHGVIVATELSQREIMDEQSEYGIGHTAVLNGGNMRYSRSVRPQASERWRAAVAHRSSHQDNATLLASALSPDGCAACAELADRNAALILGTSQQGQLSEAGALARVRDARLSGDAVRFLDGLRDHGAAAVSCAS